MPVVTYRRESSDGPSTVVDIADYDALYAHLIEAERLLRKIHDELWPGDHRDMIAAYFDGKRQSDAT